MVVSSPASLFSMQIYSVPKTFKHPDRCGEWSIDCMAMITISYQTNSWKYRHTAGLVLVACGTPRAWINDAEGSFTAVVSSPVASRPTAVVTGPQDWHLAQDDSPP